MTLQVPGKTFDVGAALRRDGGMAGLPALGDEHNKIDSDPRQGQGTAGRISTNAAGWRR